VRDAALRRLHRLTALAAAGAAALVAVFAGLAAGAVPGRKAAGIAVRPLAPLRLTQRHVARRAVRQVRHVSAPATAPAPAPAPAPPPVAPAPTPAPPVVVSGGS
jgi:hypothetical protein